MKSKIVIILSVVLVFYSCKNEHILSKGENMFVNKLKKTEFRV